MSLLGNRGRFTQDKKENFDYNHAEFDSALSLIGKNPVKFFNITTEKEREFDLKDRIKNSDAKNFEPEPYNSHQEYNKRINKYNNVLNNKHGSSYRDSDKPLVKKRKTNITLIIVMFFIEILTLAGIYFVGSIYRYSKTVQPIPFNVKNVENTDITESTLAIMKGYKTAAIFGVDSRTGSVDKGNNADVNMIVNLNLETGDAQLISVYRDLYLSVTDNNTYDKLNAAYRRGGPEQAVKSLNKNFDLNIDSYFAFNWKAVADGIELLGGIDLEITKSEYTYMNAFIHETCIATGIDAKNPAAHYIKKSGMQHLDGVQAVAYGRLRLMDSDFQRVERQKKVISLCLEKAKTLDIPKLRLIVEAVLPQIAYAFDMNEMISLLRIVRTINITESAGCPDVNNVITMSMGGSGDCVVPLNLEKAVVKLHKILFNVDDYTPSTAVKRYSNRITELRAKYTEENRENESLKESSILESIMDVTRSDSSSTNRPRSNISSASNTKSTTPIPVSAPNNLNIVDADSYPEEPEEDSNKAPFGATNNETTTRTNQTTNRTSETTAVQQAPGSGDYIVYDAPGVPRQSSNTTTNQNNAPGGNTAPGTNNNSSGGGGIVVSGPPGSIITETTAVVTPSPNVNPTNTNNDSTAVVPILGPPQ